MCHPGQESGANASRDLVPHDMFGTRHDGIPALHFVSAGMTGFMVVAP
jgi:hypothetical protein